MRRLDIVLVGHSRALRELAQELRQSGHGLTHLSAPLKPEQTLTAHADLLIEDGSLALPHPLLRRLKNCVHLSLRLSSGVPSVTRDFPPLELLFWLDSGSARHLFKYLCVSDETSGNGQDLVSRALSELHEELSTLISHFDRNADYFLCANTARASRDGDGVSLLALDNLAFVHRFNQTARPQLLAQAEIPMIERIDTSLRRFAEHPALSINEHQLSYSELGALGFEIQQLALPHLVDAQNAGARPVIGICLSRTPALYAGILAILGSGAVYLPLDSSLPPQRQQQMLEDAGVSLLLDDGRHPLRDRWPSLDISRVTATDAAQGRSLLHLPLSADEACMVLFTSGTTGRPKGVLLSQRNLGHLTAWYADHVQITGHSRVLQFSALTFDASLLDIFAALIQGAELIVPNEDQRRDPLQLISLIRRHSITHAFLPPALLGILPLDQPLGLEHVMTGGDVCEPWVIEQLVQQCHLHNLYGPTEATVLVSARQMRSGDSNRCLGVPIANSQVLILDDNLQPVLQQDTGEIYITGPGVGLGYLNAPDQTAERYLRLVLPDSKHLLVYRTGDLGRWTDEGILLCGRRDQQIKIRGMRVEPQEIEHCLRASRIWRQVAIVIDEYQRVLAFVTQPAEMSEDNALIALKQHVDHHLPEPMRPYIYTKLQKLPSTHSGKVDRKALLAMSVEPASMTTHRPPENSEEAQLLELWAELLELSPREICTDESFFNLGGHSILLSRMLLRISEQFGRSISINRFIEVPTLRKLATLVRGSSIPEELCEQAFIDATRSLDIEALPVTRMGDARKVVVTGANSFLGVHIVEALLAAGATEVACLVRGASAQLASERFTQALRDNRLDHLDMSRVRVYSADISQPLLGLTSQVYQRIDREFGALVHNAANVNHVLDYQSLAHDNVEPIFKCLQLCEGQSKKVFNFISTLSACSSTDHEGRVLESPASNTAPIYIRNGYNLSKWVGERLLQRACDLGVHVNIYRPGNISFNSVSGVCQPHKNRLLLMLKGSLQLGFVPDFSLNFDLMPVDFLARFIAFHAGQYQSGKAVFNLHNPSPLSWKAYVDSYRRAGHEFEQISITDWQQQLARVDRDNALFGVLGFYLNGFEEDIGDINLIKYGNALAGIGRMGTHYPEKTPELLSRGCEYLKDINFI